MPGRILEGSVFQLMYFIRVVGGGGLVAVFANVAVDAAVALAVAAVEAAAAVVGDVVPFPFNLLLCGLIVRGTPLLRFSIIL